MSTTSPAVVMSLSSSAPTMAPTTCAIQYAPASRALMPPRSSTPSVTAGLTWQPDTGPIEYASASRTRPKVKATGGTNGVDTENSRPNGEENEDRRSYALGKNLACQARHPNASPHRLGPVTVGYDATAGGDRPRLEVVQHVEDEGRRPAEVRSTQALSRPRVEVLAEAGLRDQAQHRFRQAQRTCVLAGVPQRRPQQPAGVDPRGPRQYR